MAFSESFNKKFPPDVDNSNFQSHFRRLKGSIRAARRAKAKRLLEEAMKSTTKRLLKDAMRSTTKRSKRGTDGEESDYEMDEN